MQQSDEHELLQGATPAPVITMGTSLSALRNLQNGGGCL